MPMRFAITTGVAVALVAAMAYPCYSDAQTYYLGAEGGWTDLSTTRDTLSGFPNRRVYNSGFNVGARGGVQFGPWRFEEEYSYRENGNSTAQLGAFVSPGGKVSGSRNSNAFMTNALYDFNINWPVTPHIGGGIGAVEINDSLRFPATGQITNSSGWEFGYQAIAGFRYDISPEIALDFDYRYLATTDASFNSRPFTVGAVTVPGKKYTSGYSTNSLLASLTYRFGALPLLPPPAPPPAPVPPPPPPPPPVVEAPPPQHHVHHVVRHRGKRHVVHHRVHHRHHTPE